MRIAGHNVVAIVAAGAAFWILGALWFGLVFSSAFQAGVGVTAETPPASPAWMIFGALLAFITPIGLSVALRWGGLPDVRGALKRAFWLWLGFGLTGAAYPLAYWPEHSVAVTAILAAYLLVGWMLAAAIIAKLK